tara:strand:+ start:500 stop:1936 length:1437 start_codon:yes stop_codon:yes gene_type:complete
MHRMLISYFVKNRVIISLLFICVTSRILTTINYIEDIDSLRFALSAIKFDILDSRPHFPGYAVYCFFLQFVYFFIKNIGITFSLLGGISIFFIIFYSKKILDELEISYTFYFVILLFFNPLLWLMSNRYMPDIMGLSFLIIGLYFFIKILKYHKLRYYIFLGISLAILAGIRLSFIPFFLPIIFLLNNSKFKYTLISCLIATLIWLIPLIYITEFKNFIAILLNDFDGHFFKWGGTILSSNVSYIDRLKKVFEFTFADGLSFWSKDRNWITILNSFFLVIASSIFIFKQSKTICFKMKKEYYLVLLCYLSYFLWIYFFQNINYKSRHIIPFIPLIITFLSIAISSLNNTKMFSKIFLYIGIIIHIYITMNLIIQHKYPSAISQINSYILNSDNKNIVVVADGLKLFYWSKLIPKNTVNFVNSNKINNDMIIKYYNSGYTILSTTRLNILGGIDYQKLDFYHNPFVNRLWSHLIIYKYE